MIIKKQVVLKEDDIYEAIKLLLEVKGISTPGNVCNFIVKGGDNIISPSITVHLSDEEAK